VVVGFGPARADLEGAAADRGLDVLFTGPLQHRHLAHLWAAADASVVPSVFPEAFGMVAAEAAATGCPPIVARHSGLAEVAAGISQFLPDHLGTALTFERNDAADLRRALVEVLGLPSDDRQALSEACRAAVVALWSWDSVARRMLTSAVQTAPDGADE
jgi:glycosyltransferase involved in cell wall biosynthesis